MDEIEQNDVIGKSMRKNWFNYYTSD